MTEQATTVDDQIWRLLLAVPDMDPLAEMAMAATILQDMKFAGPARNRDVKAKPPGECEAVLPLAAAAKASGFTLSALRTEFHKGNLSVFRIAGKDYTTLAAIERMVNTCRVITKESTCGSDRPAAAEPRPPSSSSSMAEDKLALYAALVRAKKLKSGSPITSPTNTRRNVVSVRFPKSGSRT